jgi:AraC family transcriptional regulator of adaptative response/methylated-DNA-[protein]-cysteine methyltransferase
MENTMSERIRFAWGSSSLGEFIAAVSDKGLVLFEFGANRAAMQAQVQACAPEAVIEQDDAGLADMIGKLAHVIDHPDHDPGIALDPRGSAYQQQVWKLLREIPAGETTHYGALAAKLGTRDAREVTEAIASNPIVILIPCHRVIKKDGSISGFRCGVWRKRALLKREQQAVPFRLSA